MRVLLLLALVGFAAAECPDACSGHGFCGQYDKCTCYRNWMGNACEKRTCPYDLAFVDVPMGDLNMDMDMDDVPVTFGAQINDRLGYEVWPTDGADRGFHSFFDQANDGHFYAECSNKGMCDRKSGTCSCFDGYSGTACRRVACPNDCSGHGTCERMEEFGQKYWVAKDGTNGGSTYKYELWDRYKSQVCYCDPGYFGIDCSNRYCPRGDDPLTINQKDEVQWIDINCGASACGAAETFRLSYVDTYGETWDTMPIKLTAYTHAGGANGRTANSAFAATVKAALKGIPNSVFEDVNVEFKPHHTILPGVMSLTDTKTATWTAGTTLDAITTNAVAAFLVFTGEDLLGACKTDADSDAAQEMKAAASANGAAITVAAFSATSVVAGTACKTKAHGGRLKITFTKNPGNINGLTSSHSMVTGHGDTRPATHSVIGQPATDADPLETYTDFSSFLVSGDRLYTTAANSAGGFATTTVFTVSGTPTAPQAAAVGTIPKAEAYAATEATSKTFNFYGAGTKELKECSHRGLCDYSAGLCECFNGYTNDDCGMQQALAA